MTIIAMRPDRFKKYNLDAQASLLTLQNALTKNNFYLIFDAKRDLFSVPLDNVAQAKKVKEILESHTFRRCHPTIVGLDADDSSYSVLIQLFQGTHPL